MRSLLLAALLASGCASAPVVVQPSVPRAIPLMRGINDGYHGPLPPDIVARACTWASPWMRTPHLSADSLLAFLGSVASCPSIRPLVLVEGPDPTLAASLAVVLRMTTGVLEVGNELELAPHQMTTPQYAQAVAAMHDAARATGFTGEIIAGAVYAITDDTKLRVAAMMTACPDCSVGLHIYEVPSASDLAWIRSLGRRVWVTETGSPTGCVTAQWQAQADYVWGMTATLATVENIVAVIYYQRPSGSTCDDLATFGFQAADGAWKPVEAILR